MSSKLNSSDQFSNFKGFNFDKTTGVVKLILETN